MSGLKTFGDAQRVVILGAGGGIGGALTRATGGRGFTRAEADLTDEASLKAAAEAAGDDLDLVIVAAGLLHGPDLAPEKAWRDLDGAALTRLMQVNAIGPALAAKHFLPRLAKGRKAGFAALSARVGSISDNRLGGWYGYRASKAALNQFIQTAAIELKRRNKTAFCVGLHPGTVETGLSEPFLGSAPKEVFTPDQAAGKLLAVLDGLTANDSGGLFAHDGERVAP